jgi:Ca2+-binding RTX toxin-like protein
LQGQVEVLGFPLASMGGNIGFSISPYVTLTAPPWAADPSKVYLSDLALFGSNPATDLLDDLALGIKGDLTGSVYASIDLFLFSMSWNWGIDIPVFNYERQPSWPARAGGGGQATTWPNVHQNGGVLTFSGTSGDNNITLSNGGNGAVTINWTGTGNTTGLTSQTFNGVNEVIFNGGNGNDTLTAAPDFAIPIRAVAGGGTDSFQGGAANDTLVGGTGSDVLVAGSGQDILIAGSGSDTLQGGSSNGSMDTIYGGSGNDVILAGNGHESIYGGSGQDTIRASAGSTGTYFIDGGSGTYTAQNPEIIDLSQNTGSGDSIYGGTGGYSVIHGSAGGHNLIYGGGPNATIYGAGSHDTIYGGAGTSLLQPTNNVIYGGDGGYNLIYGAGSGDQLYGAVYSPGVTYGGNNTIYGGSGSETLYGGDGHQLQPNINGVWDAAGDNQAPGGNLLVAGNGNDVIYSDAIGHNTLVAGAGNDTLWAGGGGNPGDGDYLAAGTGVDSLYGGPGNDTFQLHFTATGQQPDVIVGGPGVNSLVLKPDTVQGGPNADPNGPNGKPALPAPNDYKIYLTKVTATQAANTVAGSSTFQATLYNLDNGDTLGQVNFAMPPGVANLELEGGPGNNWIQVDPSVNENISMYGGPGNNTLIAGSGNDTLVAGSGTSVLYGGAGSDVLYGGDLPQQDATPVLDPSQSWTAETGNTINGDPTITGLAGTTGLTKGQIVSGSGIPAGSRISSIDESTNSITLNNPATATASAITLAFGSSTPEGHDTLIAGSGNSELYAGGGGDVLIGGSATLENNQFVLQPGAGRDLLEGGSGNDLLVAGIGSPGCVLLAGSGNDILVAQNSGSNIMVSDNGGNDLFLGYAGSNAIDASGSSGNDTLVGGNGFNSLIAGNGTDLLYDYPDSASWNLAVQQAATNFNVRLISPFGPTQGNAGQDQIWTLLDTLQTQPQGFTTTQQVTLSSLLDQQLQALGVTDTTGAQILTQLYNLQTQNPYQGNIQQLVRWLDEDPIVHNDLEQIFLSLLDNPGQGLSHNQNYLWVNLLADDLTSDASQESQVAQQIKDLAAIDFIAGSETAAQFTLLANESFTLSGDEGLVSKLLGATNAADSLQAGNGVDYLYGNPGLPTWMAGGGGQDTFFNFNGHDTILGGNGNQNTVMFRGDGTFNLQPDSNLAALDVSLTDPSNNTTTWVVGNIKTASGSITNVQVIGVQTGDANKDMVNVNVATLPAGLTGIYVKAGNGTGDIIDAHTVAATAGDAAPATLLGGAGADKIIIGTAIGAGSVYQGNSASELDVVDSQTGNDSVSVVSGKLTIDGLPINSQSGNTSNGNPTITGLTNANLLSVGQSISGNGIQAGSTIASIVSANAITISNAATASATNVTLTFGITFHTLKVIGTSGTSTTPVTNQFQSDGTIASVFFEGGAGPFTTNVLTAGGRTDELIGGDGASNTFTLNGPGNYTVVGGTGATNALTLNCDNMGDELEISQSGTTINMTGGTFAGTATNMGNAAVAINGGNGDDYLDAAGMLLPVTLNGGAGNDVLIGGQGNDTLVYNKNGNDAYGGGGGAANVLVFPCTQTGAYDDVSLNPTSIQEAYYSGTVNTFPRFFLGAHSYSLANATNIQVFQVTGNPDAVFKWDDVFTNGDWTNTLISQHGGTYSASQVSQGSNSASGYSIEGTDTPPSSSNEDVAHISSRLWYNAATYGTTINSISVYVYLSEVSWYGAYFNPQDRNTGGSVQVILEQGNQVFVSGGSSGPYYSQYGFRITGPNQEQTLIVSGSADQWNLWTGAGADSSVHPDFSASGGLIQFGFVTESFLPFTWRVDDYQVSVNDSRSQDVVQMGYPLAPTGMTTNSDSSNLLKLEAQFADGNPAASATASGGTIDWGDGTTSTGNVAIDSAGNVTIDSSHYYATNGTYTITSDFIDSAGNASSTTISYTGGLELVDGDLRNYTGSSYTTLDTGVQSYVVRNADLSIFDLHTDHTFWVMNANLAPEQLGSDIQSMSFAPDGTVYALDGQGNLFYSDLQTYTLQSSDTNVKAFAIDQSGTLYKLYDNGSLQVLTQNGSGWTTVNQGNQSIQSMVLEAAGTAVDVMDTEGNYWQLTDSTWNWLAGPHFRFTVAGSVTAGQPASVTLNVFDYFYNPVPGYTGTVLFTNTDGGAGPPPAHTFTVNDSGSYSFTVTFKTAGVQMLTATDSASVTSTANVTVNPAAVAHLRVAGPTSTVVVSNALPITVTADDAYGNVVTGYTGTVNLVSSDPLNIRYTFTTGTGADNGVHTFFIPFDAVGSQSVAVNDTGNVALTGRGSFVVKPGRADLAQSSVAISPTIVAPGGTVTVVLTARDAEGNQETSGGLTVAFGLAPGSAGGAFGPVVDGGDGIYTASFTSNNVAGFNTFTATIGGQAVTTKSPILIVPVYTVSLAPIPENIINPVGTAIGPLLRNHDDDPITRQGIAVIAQTGAGTWQYSANNGQSWSAIIGASLGHALLLPANDLVRYVPAVNENGAFDLVFLAWDHATGTSGQYLNITSIGGGSSFSGSAAMVIAPVTHVRQAPRWLSGSVRMTPELPGAINPPGDSIVSIFGSHFNDVDGNSVGIAVTGATSTSHGTWAYSTDGGANWTTFGTTTTVFGVPSTNNALLLPGTDLIRFVPNAGFSGRATLSAVAWDGTKGTSTNAGATTGFDIVATGGTSAFSASTINATIRVNTAPTLTSGPVTVWTKTITEGAVSPAVAVVTLLAQTAASQNATGIAITGASGAGSGGYWQYSPANSTIWHKLPGVSEAVALLLPATTILRFHSVANGNGQATLTFRAWDGSAGAAGMLFPVQMTGAATALSSDEASVSITVSPVNHAPSWAASSVSLAPVLPGTTTPVGVTITDAIDAVFRDIDGVPLPGVAIVGAASGTTGFWEYSLDGGADWSHLPAVTPSSALLLSGNDLIAYVPNTDTNGTDKLQLLAWDGSNIPAVQDGQTGVNLSGSGASGGSTAYSANFLNLTETINVAPTLNTGPVSLPAWSKAITEGSANLGLPVSALLSKAGASTDAVGIAVTGAEGAGGSGSWQYLPIGMMTWRNVPAVSASLAFALPSAAQVRFQSGANGNGTATLTFHAWDGTQGKAVDVFAVTATGGATAFSSAEAAASIAVNAINHAPRWTGSGASLTPIQPGTYSLTSNPPAGDTVASIFGSYYNDSDGNPVGVAVSATSNTNGTWQYSHDDGASWNNLQASLNTALLLAGNDRLRFVPNAGFIGTATLAAYAWDGSDGKSAGSTVDLSSNSVLGGSTPFSTSALTATSIVNTAPTLHI